MFEVEFEKRKYANGALYTVIEKMSTPVRYMVGQTLPNGDKVVSVRNVEAPRPNTLPKLRTRFSVEYLRAVLQKPFIRCKWKDMCYTQIDTLIAKLEFDEVLVAAGEKPVSRLSRWTDFRETMVFSTCKNPTVVRKLDELELTLEIKNYFMKQS